jgi:tRNA threonylcarbamoyl adenosine modification protein (Sua5/YciO/YrdC/YwlC family)
MTLTKTKLPATARLDEVRTLLEKGEVVILPTVVAYIFVANAREPEAIDRIHQLKRWNPPQPMALLTNRRKVSEFAEVSSDAGKLIDRFPYPITLIVPSKERLPESVTAGYKTLFIACPDRLIYNLVENCPFPIVCTPAGFGADYKARSYESAIQLFGDSVPLIVDGGKCHYEMRATLIDCSLPIPTIMNFGAVSVDDLRPIVSNIELPSHLRK